MSGDEVSENGCEHVVDLLPDWVAGRLDDPRSGDVAAHLVTCPACAAEADVVRRLHAARPAAPSDLARRITAAAHAQNISGQNISGRGARRGVRRIAPVWALSAAAVLALAVGTTVFIDRREPGPTELAEQVAVDEDAGVWIADDAFVAGAPVLEELSDDDLAALLEDMGG